MKTRLIGFFGILLGLTALEAQDGAKRDPAQPASKTPTHEELLRRRSKAKVDEGIKRAQDPIKKGPSGRSASLVDSSATLFYDKHWTLVPKEAVLYVPPHLKSRVNSPKRGGTLVPWKEFLAANKLWVHVKPVTLAQARGEQPLPKEDLAQYKTMGKVVVAVCHGGPISVKAPPKEGPDGKPVAGK